MKDQETMRKLIFHSFLLGILLAGTIMLAPRTARADCAVTGGVGPASSATSTQCIGLFANPLCPNCPGFTPINLLKHVDPTQCAIGPCTAPFFNRLGPGAITDNMFGIISGPDPGPDGILGTGDDVPTYRCGRTVGTLTNGLPGLNCGDIRFDPVSQGMVIPGDPAGMGNTLQPFTSDFPTQIDFCAVGGTDCLSGGIQQTDPHMGYLASNTFHWASCGGASGPPPPPGCTTSNQTEQQVNLIIPGAAGTLANPNNAGEVQVTLTTSWQTNNSSPTAFDNPKVSWTQYIYSPDLFTSQGQLIQNDTGVLQYSGNNSILPVVTYPAGPMGLSLSTP